MLLEPAVCPMSCYYKQANLSAAALPLSMVDAGKAHWHFSQCYRTHTVNLDWFHYQIALKQEKTMFLFQINLAIEGFLGSNGPT